MISEEPKQNTLNNLFFSLKHARVPKGLVYHLSLDLYSMPITCHAPSSQQLEYGHRAPLILAHSPSLPPRRRTAPRLFERALDDVDQHSHSMTLPYLLSTAVISGDSEQFADCKYPQTASAAVSFGFYRESLLMTRPTAHSLDSCYLVYVVLMDAFW